MNIKWMSKYAVIIKGGYMDMVRYLIPLSDQQIRRERVRIGHEGRILLKHVQLVRVM